MKYPKTEHGGRYNGSDSGQNRMGWYGKEGHRLMSKHRRHWDQEEEVNGEEDYWGSLGDVGPGEGNPDERRNHSH